MTGGDKTLEKALNLAQERRKQKIEQAEKDFKSKLKTAKDVLSEKGYEVGGDKYNAKIKKIEAWYKNKLSKIDDSYSKRAVAAHEKAIRREKRREERRKARKEAHRKGRQEEEVKSSEDRSEQKHHSKKAADNTLEEYKALRKAIGQYCRGVDGALSPQAVKCLERIFFNSSRFSRLKRWAKGSSVNICDLDNDMYKRLRGQKVLPIDSRGVVGSPPPGADCSDLAISGAAEVPVAAWSDWGKDIFKIALSKSTTLPYQIALLGKAPLTSALGYLTNNPLISVTGPLPLVAAVAANSLVRYMIFGSNVSGGTLLALDGLYMLTAMMPRYAEDRRCLDKRKLHAVPARFMFAGGFLAALIVGIMFGALMSMTAGQTGLAVGLFATTAGDVVQKAYNNLSDKRELGLMTTALSLGAALAAVRGVVGEGSAAMLSAMLQKVVYGTLFKLKEMGWFTDSKILRGVMGLVHGLTGGDVADVPLLMELLSEVGSTDPNIIGEGVGHLSRVPGIGKIEAVQEFITEAANKIADMVLNTNAGNSTYAKASEIAKNNLSDFFRKFVETPIESLTSSNLVNAYDKVKGLLTPEGAAAEIGSFTHILPPFFAGGYFGGLFVSIKLWAECEMARLLYEQSQRALHKV